MEFNDVPDTAVRKTVSVILSQPPTSEDILSSYLLKMKATTSDVQNVTISSDLQVSFSSMLYSITINDEWPEEFCDCDSQELHCTFPHGNSTIPTRANLSDLEMTCQTLESWIQGGHFASVTDIVLRFDDPSVHDHQAYSMYGESENAAWRPNWLAMKDIVSLCKVLGEQLLTVTIRLCMLELTFPIIPSLYIFIRQCCPKLERVTIEDTMCPIFDNPNLNLLNSFRRIVTEECAFDRSCLSCPIMGEFSSLDVEKRLFNQWSRQFLNDSWKIGDGLKFSGAGFSYGPSAASEEQFEGFVGYNDYESHRHEFENEMEYETTTTGRLEELEFLSKLVEKILTCPDPYLCGNQVHLRDGRYR